MLDYKENSGDWHWVTNLFFQVRALLSVSTLNTGKTFTYPKKEGHDFKVKGDPQERVVGSLTCGL